MDEILLHHADLPADAVAALDALPGGAAPGWPGAVAVRGPRARLERLLGFALLLDCVRTAGLAAPDPGEIRTTAAGKPCWTDGPSFSISHAGGRVACAFSTRGEALGLDLEERAAVARVDLRLVASAAELARFRAAGLTPADVWTAKEAVVKAAGSTLGAVARVEASRDSASFEGADYQLMRVEVGAGFSCTVAAIARRRVSVARVDASQALSMLG